MNISKECLEVKEVNLLAFQNLFLIPIILYFLNPFIGVFKTTEFILLVYISSCHEILFTYPLKPELVHREMTWKWYILLKTNLMYFIFKILKHAQWAYFFPPPEWRELVIWSLSLPRSCCNSKPKISMV